MAWAFQRNSEFAECFNYHLQKMREAGLFDRLYSEYVDIKQKDTLIREKNDAVSLGFMNAAFPSLVLLGGLTLAIIQVMAESLWNRLKRHKKVRYALKDKKVKINGWMRNRRNSV